jgi:CBS domain-containing protein
MTVEIAEIAGFLERTPPFEALSDTERAALSRTIEVRYARSGSAIVTAGDQNDRLFIVRSGAVELRLAGNDLTARLATGSTFAYPSLLRGGEVHNTTVAIEDTLLYAVPADRFHALRDSCPRFRKFFAEGEAARIAHALKDRQQAAGFQLDREMAGKLIRRSMPVSCPSETTIADAVQLMHARDVSTLAIYDEGALTGIFTDKDLRNRVVAAGLPLEGKIGDVMTPSPLTLSTDSSAAEAMALMTSGGFRHIPLLDEAGALSGILSATDILAAVGNNAIDLGVMIARARTPKELIEVARRIPESFTVMVDSGVHAAQAMRFTSALGEAVHRKAAQLAEAELGDSPNRYALVVFGSLAREEQLVGSDQDNGLVLADDTDEEGASYFEKLGTRISDLLDECGYVYCRGGIMAKNADQRQTLAGWCDRYAQWISRPDEDRILRATIFFDIRHIHGDASLSRRLHEQTVALVKDSPLFVSYLARDALRSKVPLGIFRNLVLETSDDGQRVFDAKRQAIMPIVDIARTHALAAGLEEVGTVARLRALAQAGKMNRDDAQSLEDAMLLVNEMRIAHQARQVERGEAPDNLIAPDTLSPLERDYLKDAFSLIRSALEALRRNFAGGIA